MFLAEVFERKGLCLKENQCNPQQWDISSVKFLRMGLFLKISLPDPATFTAYCSLPLRQEGVTRSKSIFGLHQSSTYHQLPLHYLRNLKIFVFDENIVFQSQGVLLSPKQNKGGKHYQKLLFLIDISKITRLGPICLKVKHSIKFYKLL